MSSVGIAVEGPIRSCRYKNVLLEGSLQKRCPKTYITDVNMNTFTLDTYMYYQELQVLVSTLGHSWKLAKKTKENNL